MRIALLPDRMKNDAFIYVIVAVAFIIFVAAVAFGLSGGLGSGQGMMGQKSTITITASGTVSNESSQAYMYVLVNGTGATNHLAVQNVSSTLAQFNSTILKYLNGNMSEITTTYFNVYKIYNKSAYEADESMTVTMPNIGNVSPAISELSNINDVYVTGASPALSDSQVSAMRIQALALAMANATAQARAVIGKNSTIYATNISIDNYYVFPYRLYGTEVTAATPAALPSNFTITPEFYGGTNQVTESVTVIFTYGQQGLS